MKTKITQLIKIFSTLLLTSSSLAQSIKNSKIDYDYPEEDLECYSDDSGKFCIRNYAKRNTIAQSLFFVTPWNKVGYQLAQTHASKIDYLSPVWFYIEKNKKTGIFEFQGRQDIVPSLLRKVKEYNPTMKILPRFYVKADKEEVKWVMTPKITNRIFEELVSIANEFGLDGYVFDIPMLNYLKFKSGTKKFLTQLNYTFSHLTKFVTFAGTRIHISTKKEEIEPYASIFDKILICTYDYPRGWLSPMEWYRKNGEFYSKMASELDLKPDYFMLGIQFYGYIEGIKAMTRRQFQVEE